MSYAKLIVMLSSDNDGEVVSAARAIDRKLKADGKDWHWLASKLSLADKVQMQATKPPFLIEIYEKVNYLVDHPYLLFNERQREFIFGLRARVDKEEWINLTSAQKAYLNDLYNRRYGKRGAR